MRYSRTISPVWTIAKKSFQTWARQITSPDLYSLQVMRSMIVSSSSPASERSTGIWRSALRNAVLAAILSSVPNRHRNDHDPIGIGGVRPAGDEGDHLRRLRGREHL